MRWDERWSTDNGNAWRARFIRPNMSYIRYSQSGPKERRNSDIMSAYVLWFTYMAQSASSCATRLASVQGAISSRSISYIHMPQVDITWRGRKLKKRERKRERKSEKREEKKKTMAVCQGAKLTVQSGS